MTLKSFPPQRPQRAQRKKKQDKGRRIDLKDIGETNVMVPVEIED